MTKGQIATTCKAIEELEARGTKYSKLRTLFTEEAFQLFEVPVFECCECGRKTSYNKLVNADEMEVDEIVAGYATCEKCCESFGNVRFDSFSDLFSDVVNILNELKIM